MTGVAETNPCGVAIIPGGGSFVFGLNVDEPFIIDFVGMVVVLVVNGATVVVIDVVIGDCSAADDGKTTPGGVGIVVIIDVNELLSLLEGISKGT